MGDDPLDGLGVDFAGIVRGKFTAQARFDQVAQCAPLMERLEFGLHHQFIGQNHRCFHTVNCITFTGVYVKLIDVPGGDRWMGRLSLGGDPIHDCPGAGRRERVTLDNESGN